MSFEKKDKMNKSSLSNLASRDSKNKPLSKLNLIDSESDKTKRNTMIFPR